MPGTGQDRPSTSRIIVAVLAIVQTLFGLLRTADWVEIGNDLSRRGVLMLPVSVLAFGRGILVALIAVLYAVFAWGLLARRGWARGPGLAAAAMNLLLAGLMLTEVGLISSALIWMIVDR